jgi:hypothetical protein
MKRQEEHCFNCQNFRPMKQYGDYGACTIDGIFQTLLNKYHKKCENFTELFIVSALKNSTEVK